MLVAGPLAVPLKFFDKLLVGRSHLNKMKIQRRPIELARTQDHRVTLIGVVALTGDAKSISRRRRGDHERFGEDRRLQLGSRHFNVVRISQQVDTALWN